MDVIALGYGILSAAGTGVTSLVPAARIKPRGGNQNLARPYLVHFLVSGGSTYTHQGRAVLDQADYQVSVFADSYASLRAVADAVIASLDGVHGGAHFFLRSEGPQLFEDDVAVYHLPLTWDVWAA